MKTIPILNQDIRDDLTSYQKNLINNKPEMNLYEDLCETQDRIEEKESFGIESDLNELGKILARLCSKGVDRRIISDTMINSVEVRDLTEFCSNFDSYLRSVKF